MNKKAKRLYMKLIILILCLLIIIRIFTLVLSRYESESTGNANVDIAFYLLKEDYKSMTLNLDSIIPQNNAYVYDFSVSNQDETNTAEIDLTYDLTIRTTTNLPLTYDLFMNQKYTDNGATSIIKTNEIVKDEDDTYFRKITTETETLLYQEPKTNNYQLIVYFPSEYNTDDYQDIIEAIEINVNSKQYT